MGLRRFLMWLFARPCSHRAREPLAPEMVSHSERLHEAIKQSANTNARILDNTTKKSFDQVQRSQDVILTVRSVVGRLSAGDALDTVKGAMDLVSRDSDETDN